MRLIASRARFAGLGVGLAAILAISLPIPDAAARQRATRWVWDGSGTMLIRFDGSRHGVNATRRRDYPFWWYGYQGPERWRDGDSAEMDPALGVDRPPIYRFAYVNYRSGGYYDLFPYGLGLPRTFSPFASARYSLSPVGWRPWWRQPGTYHGPVLAGRTLRVDPELIGTQVEAGPAFERPEPIAFQAAVVALLREGEYEAVIDVWRRAASGAPVKATGLPAYPGATPAQVPVAVEGVWATDSRLRAVAMAGVGDLEAAGVAMMDEYLIDPELAALALAGDLVAPGPGDLRRMLRQAIRFADRNPSPDAWLLAGVLTQAEGRDRVAATFIGRAEVAGLDIEVAEAFYDALGGRPAPEGR